MVAMNPAQHIVDKCGGHSAVADMLGIHISRVYRWTYPRAKGGTDGAVPTQHQQALVDRARARGIRLAPADFFERKPVRRIRRRACA